MDVRVGLRLVLLAGPGRLRRGGLVIRDRPLRLLRLRDRLGRLRLGDSSDSADFPDSVTDSSDAVTDSSTGAVSDASVSAASVDPVGCSSAASTGFSSWTASAVSVVTSGAWSSVEVAADDVVVAAPPPASFALMSRSEVSGWSAGASEDVAVAGGDASAGGAEAATGAAGAEVGRSNIDRPLAYLPPRPPSPPDGAEATGAAAGATAAGSAAGSVAAGSGVEVTSSAEAGVSDSSTTVSWASAASS